MLVVDIIGTETKTVTGAINNTEQVIALKKVTEIKNDNDKEKEEKPSKDLAPVVYNTVRKLTGGRSTWVRQAAAEKNNDNTKEKKQVKEVKKILEDEDNEDDEEKPSEDMAPVVRMTARKLTGGRMARVRKSLATVKSRSAAANRKNYNESDESPEEEPESDDFVPDDSGDSDFGNNKRKKSIAASVKKTTGRGAETKKRYRNESEENKSDSESDEDYGKKNKKKVVPVSKKASPTKKQRYSPVNESPSNNRATPRRKASASVKYTEDSD